MEKKKRDPRQLSIDKHIQRLKPYMRGLSDEDIAREIGLTKSGVASWRNTNKLPVNRTASCLECGRPMEGIWLKDGDMHDLYRYWKCPACGGEFWPAEEEREAG